MTAAPHVDIIPRPPEDALPWEKLSVALVDILGGMQQIVTVDELQRADAALGESYRGLSSFERLTQTAVNVLVAKGLVDEATCACAWRASPSRWRATRTARIPRRAFPMPGSTTSADCRAGRSTGAIRAGGLGKARGRAQRCVVAAAVAHRA